MGTLSAPVVADALRDAGIDGVLADGLTALLITGVGTAAGGSAGAAAAFNEVTNNYLSHQERATLNKADKACKTSGQQCDTAAALKYKDELSDRLLANAVAACEGQACNDAVNFINQQLAAVGCTAPQACPDQTTLLGYWNVAQQKAQGLEGVYPETWLLDAKAVLDLGKLGIRVLAGSAKGSLDALHTLSKASADDLAKVNNNALRDDWQQFDHYRKPSSMRPGGEWDWQKQAPNNGAVPGTSRTSTIEQGRTLDRYGSRSGEYLSPVNTPLEQRALPPGKQADPYEQYSVLKPFTVVEEKIAPAFNQPGGGVQMRAKIPEVQNRFATIDDLIRHGYFKDPAK